MPGAPTAYFHRIPYLPCRQLVVNPPAYPSYSSLSVSNVGTVGGMTDLFRSLRAHPIAD